MNSTPPSPEANRQPASAAGLRAAPGSASGRLLYIHDYYPPSGEWRVYEALMLHAIGDEMLMVLVDDTGALRVVKERHLSKRNSAAFFVYDNELHLLAADVESDYARRQCWRLAYEDVQRLKARMPNNQAHT